jgi:hypothetical protein
LPTNLSLHPEPELIAHIPVDCVDISEGPADVVCQTIQASLQHRNQGQQSIEIYETVVCVLKTPASATHFQRELKVIGLTIMINGGYSFTAIFSGRIVVGTYNPVNRTGRFSLNKTLNPPG